MRQWSGEIFVKRRVSSGSQFAVVYAVLTLNVLVARVPIANAIQYEVGVGETYTSIQQCLDVVEPGDTCNIHSGTYTEQLVLRSNGTHAKRITIQRHRNDMVTVRSSATPVVSLNGKSYWNFDGVNITYDGTDINPRGFSNFHSASIDYITIKNLAVGMNGGSGTEGACIHIADGNHVTVDRVTCAVTASMAHGQGIDGFSFLFNSNLQVLNNRIYGNADEITGRLEDGIVVSGTNILIDNNEILDGWAYDTHPDGIVVQGDGDRNGNLPDRITITRNTIKNFSQGIYVDPVRISAITNVLIANNLVYQTSDFRYGGRAAMNGMTFKGKRVGRDLPYATLDLKVHNNTIETKQFLIYVLQTSTETTIDISNNIFVAPPYGAVNARSVSGVKLNHNCYIGGVSKPIAWGETAYTFPAFQSLTGQETESFADPVGLNSDYRPKSQSNCNGRGANLSAHFQVDKAGRTRQSFPHSWDIGAFSYQPSDGHLPAPPSNLQMR